MREVVKDKGRIEHMMSAIDNVEEFTKGVTLDEFVKSKVLFYAVVKNIEIIGEATYMLTNDFKQTHNTIPWQLIEKCVTFWSMVIIGDFYKLLFKRFMNLSLRRFLYFLKEHSELCD